MASCGFWAAVAQDTDQVSGTRRCSKRVNVMEETAIRIKRKSAQNGRLSIGRTGEDGASAYELKGYLEERHLLAR